MKDGRSMKKRHRKAIGFAKVRQSMEKGKNSNVTNATIEHTSYEKKAV